jgi:hypothetical protein
MRTNPFYSSKWWIGAILLTVLVSLAGCTAKQPTTLALANRDLLQPLSDQFSLVNKDGVEIACPNHWLPQSDPNVVYCVSRSDYIRITVAVLSALPQSYYDELVAQGTVTETMVHGYPTYMNQNAYPYQDHQMINKCMTVVDGSQVCHIMILCDASLLQTFEPTFDYVLNSLNFAPIEQ